MANGKEVDFKKRKVVQDGDNKVGFKKAKKRNIRKKTDDDED